MSATPSAESSAHAMSVSAIHACTNEEIQFTGLGVYGTVKANPDIEVVAAWDYDVQRGKEADRPFSVQALDQVAALLLADPAQQRQRHGVQLLALGSDHV